MSKEALKWLGSNASFTLTGTKGVPEDLEMGKRMRSIGILTEDTRDAEGIFWQTFQQAYDCRG